MGFFQDLKEDLSQAVTELVPEEEAVIDEKQAEDDLAEIEAMLKEKEETAKEEKKDRKIDINAKMSITGVIEGNSQAAEIYAESAKITGEVRSLGTVKVGQETVIIGDIYATSAVIAGAVKGDIDVHGPVILDTTAIVMGNIKSKSVQINNGAVIEGMCSQCYAEVNPTSFFDEIKKAGRKK